MGNLWNKEALSRLLENLKKDYDVFAPRLYAGTGCYSDTDILTQISSATVSLSPLMKLSGMKNPITALRKHCCPFLIPLCILQKTV